MNMTAIARTIHARIMDDSGPGGLLNTTDGLLYDPTRVGPSRFRRNYSSDVESTVLSGFPVVVWRLGANSAGRPTFTSDELELLVSFDIFGRPPISVSDTGDADVYAIADRIYGDSSGQVGGTPTYGLHRFQPDSTHWGGWEPASQFWFLTSDTTYDEKLIVCSMTFRLTYGRTQPVI